MKNVIIIKEKLIFLLAFPLPQLLIVNNNSHRLDITFVWIANS